MADSVAFAPVGRTGASLQRKCKSCQEEEEQHLHRKPAASAGPRIDASPQLDARIAERSGSGAGLDSTTRSFFEPRFRHDFSQVRVHADQEAAAMAESVSANAFTVANDIYFAPGRYAPGTNAGDRLLAHELTHVVQQSGAHHSRVMQRDEFAGGPGTTAKDKDRPIHTFKGTLPATKSPGGTIVPNTAGTGQNCAGDSCSIQKFINWPFLGQEAPGLKTAADWSKANTFVPSGCTRVSCSGVDVNNTRCNGGDAKSKPPKPAELELIVFLYQWPISGTLGGKPVTGTQSDYHMIGRTAEGLPKGWHSKMDRREKVVDIRDPWQSLHDAYPHTLLKDRTVNQLCFCCNQSAISVI